MLVKLVRALEQFQAKFVPLTPTPGTSGSDDNVNDSEGALKSDELNLKNAQDVSYLIHQLIRGLALSSSKPVEVEIYVLLCVDNYLCGLSIWVSQSVAVSTCAPGLFYNQAPKTSCGRESWYWSYYINYLFIPIYPENKQNFTPNSPYSSWQNFKSHDFSGSLTTVCQLFSSVSHQYKPSLGLRVSLINWY